LLRERYAEAPEALSPEEKERAEQLLARDARKKEKKVSRTMEKDHLKDLKKAKKQKR